MSFVPRCCRTAIHWALGLLVVAALSRCMWEESRELAQRTSILAYHRQALPSPIQAPVHDCDRESGCICRGATQVVAVAPPPAPTQLSDWLPPPKSELVECWLADVAAEASPDDLDFTPPISGRQLRALYASLVI